MPTRREFTGHLVGGAALLAVAGAASTMEGCSAISELETWVPVGLSAFDTLISYINPVAGSALAVAVTTANALWEAVATAVANYQHTTDPTNTLLDKIIAVMDSLEGGLGSVLAAIPASIPAAVLRAVQFGFGLLLATLKSIQAQLEPTASASTKAAKAQTVNGVAAATSVKSFISSFNANVCVPSGYPRRLK